MNSKELAKRIVDSFIRVLPSDDCEITIASMLENFRISEINKYVNSINTENMAKMKAKEPVVKQENSNIERVKAWPRGV